MRTKKLDQLKRELSLHHGLNLQLKILKNGEEKVYEKCHSFSRWANRWLMNSLTSNNIIGMVEVAKTGWTKLQLKDVNGVLSNWFEGYNQAGYYHQQPQREYFHFIRTIAIGESDDAWSYDQYHLVAFKKWADTYTVKTDVTETDSSLYFELQGLFDITESFSIREVGLYGNCLKAFPANDNQVIFLVSRDVLSSPVPVSPGDTISVIYRLTVG